jgi:hypothetical protein
MKIAMPAAIVAAAVPITDFMVINFSIAIPPECTPQLNAVTALTRE